MRNGITREFDVRLRDEECDRANGITQTDLNRIAEREAAYLPVAEWEIALQLFADDVLKDYYVEKKGRPANANAD